MRLSLAAAAALSLSFASAGATQVQKVRVYGVAPIPLRGTWTTARKAGSAAQLEAWALGFVSGYNFYSPESAGDIAPTTDARALLAWIDGYCQANPLDNVLHGATKLVRELKRRAAPQ